MKDILIRLLLFVGAVFIPNLFVALVWLLSLMSFNLKAALVSDAMLIFNGVFIFLLLVGLIESFAKPKTNEESNL